MGDRARGWVASVGKTWVKAAVKSLVVLFVVTVFAASMMWAQTYTVIHNFTGGQDGASPMAGLTIDRAGNLYGTANYGGNTGGNCGGAGCGTVYRLTSLNSSWVLAPLYSFAGGTDGANPQAANVVIGSDGTVYSTTFYGGDACNGFGCGTVFRLQPPGSACRSALCLWTETVLHRFNGTDGANPVGAIVFDQAGNIDGVTNSGGFRNGGAVYQLSKADGWMSTILFSPYGYPGSSVTMDHAGNLFGSTFFGGNGYGSVYKLTKAGSGWIGGNLYDFAYGNDGGYPRSGVIIDQAENLYGATSSGGSGNGGTVFQMTPSGGSWSLTTLYSFANPENGFAVVGPVGNLTMDTAGNLYGTTLVDGAHGYGAVFKLTSTNGNWAYTSLHDFSGGDDGAYPYSNLVFDASGNIYGTASAGGANGLGVVFEITP
jgi:uncharacterized repeat protein (TIGR03803 family)